jgi:hypothetical protein
MPHVETTDVGTMARPKLTPHQRLRVWERAAGVCCVQPAGSTGYARWIVEHICAGAWDGDEIDDLASP